MTDLELAYLSAWRMTDMVQSGEVSPVELIENALARIDEVNPALNAFCFVWDESARAEASAAADAVARGDAVGPLHGLPIAIKDTTPTAGCRTTLGSYTHEHWVPTEDAAIVKALRRAGAIIVGKTTTPEFAHSSITDSPLWGPTRNPWDLSRTPGGSSGGSGAAVASGCVPLAEGSDMGGSVRIPAAWSGVVGLKPSLGRIPMNALPGLFDNISHHGPLARCVDDARLFLASTQGSDDADILSIPGTLDLGAALDGDVRGMRLGLSIDLGCWDVDPAIGATVQNAADALGQAGATVVDVNPGFTAGDDDLWVKLWGVFMAAYFGHFADEFADRMDPNVLRLIEYGRSFSAVEYKRLDIDRTETWRRLRTAMSGVDVLLCPTMSTAPVPAERENQVRTPTSDDGLVRSHDMTGVFNLTSPCPAMSVPIGLHPDGTPIGLQIVGHRWDEPTVLRVGRAVELNVAPIGHPPI